jgi:hypothetical protein
MSGSHSPTTSKFNRMIASLTTKCVGGFDQVVIENLQTKNSFSLKLNQAESQAEAQTKDPKDEKSTEGSRSHHSDGNISSKGGEVKVSETACVGVGEKSVSINSSNNSTNTKDNKAVTKATSKNNGDKASQPAANGTGGMSSVISLGMFWERVEGKLKAGVKDTGTGSVRSGEPTGIKGKEEAKSRETSDEAVVKDLVRSEAVEVVKGRDKDKGDEKRKETSESDETKSAGTRSQDRSEISPKGTKWRGHVTKRQPLRLKPLP